MDDVLGSFKRDKTAFSVAALSDESDQRAFWAGRTPQERMRASEFTRLATYGYDPSARLQRLLEVAQLGDP